MRFAVACIQNTKPIGLYTFDIGGPRLSFHNFQLGGCNRMTGSADQTGTPSEVCGFGGVTSLLGV
jgi:hypothetical protein